MSAISTEKTVQRMEKLLTHYYINTLKLFGRSLCKWIKLTKTTLGTVVDYNLL